MESSTAARTEIGFVREGNDGHKRRVPLAEDIPWLKTASKRKRWLVGVSGGADSVALLHLLLEAGFKSLVVCHLDHNLRGRESKADARFVKDLAERLGLTCEIAGADVTGRMEMSGQSMETAARHARHDFFADCARKYRCRRVVLAHHADDQAETVLWNLLRGSHGLKGMEAEKSLVTEDGTRLELMRPLLALRHAELVAWLQVRGLGWREDASNLESVAVRNRLRNEAIPLLAEIAGRDVVGALVRGAADRRDDGDLLAWALDQVQVQDPQGRLHLPVIRTLPIALQRGALRKYLQEHGVGSPDRGLIESSLSLLDVANPAVVNLPGGGRLRRAAGRLWVEA